MLTRTSTLGVCLTLAMFASGCTTHRQLRRNTVNQSETVSDIYTQQVLDNLAIFVYDSNSLPFFAFPNQGTNQVTDKGEVGVALAWLAAAFEGVGLEFGAEREMQEAWTTSPISDPHKLALMRCAYQQALAGYIDGVVSRDCPKCDSIQDVFYGSSAHEGGIDKKCLEQWAEDFGWLGIGCKEHIPKHCGCELVGYYCGNYVWVLPGNRDKLTQLTLAILDYATFEPAEAEKKMVVVTVERDANDTVIKTTRQETFTEDVKKDGKTVFRRGPRTSHGAGDPSPDLLRFNQQLQMLPGR